MTVAELIEILKEMPEDAEVYTYSKNRTFKHPDIKLHTPGIKYKDYETGVRETVFFNKTVVIG